MAAACVLTNLPTIGRELQIATLTAKSKTYDIPESSGEDILSHRDPNNVQYKLANTSSGQFSGGCDTALRTTTKQCCSGKSCIDSC